MSLGARHWIPALLIVVGCSTTTPLPPELQQSSFHMEGLDTLDTDFPGVLLVKPDHEMASYDYVMVDPIVLTYRTSSLRFTSSETENLRTYLREAVARELVNLEPSQIVTQPGPCVLRMQTAFIDLELPDLPDRATAATAFVDSFGTVTLVHQILDSETGELLLRYVGRWRAAGGQVVGGGDPWVHMSRTLDRMLHQLQESLIESVPQSRATTGPRAACTGQVNRTIEKGSSRPGAP